MTRDEYVAKLYEKIPDINWESVVDKNVYICDRGIRMLGSRKASNGIDKGRIYNLIFAIDRDGKKYMPEMTNFELLKAVSIHV